MIINLTPKSPLQTERGLKIRFSPLLQREEEAGDAVLFRSILTGG